MVSIATVLLFSLLGGVFSLIGGFLLLSRRRISRDIVHYATPFAAGALLAAAFLDLLPEATHEGQAEAALLWALVGILGFFLLERLLHWFHHHHEHDKKADMEANAPLIIIGDTLHNFIDGIAIAAAFLVDFSTGVVATVAVAAHEIPQEIGDFGLLLKKGMKPQRVILVNIFSALATTIAALIFFRLGTTADLPLGPVLGVVAGFFIYIAVSDIIPTIHRQEEKRFMGWQSALLILGVLVVGLVNSYAHNFIEHEESHEQENNHVENEVSEHGQTQTDE